MIFVESEQGLPPVDRRFYVVQGEIYASQANGAKGKLMESLHMLMVETAQCVVFNGATNALTIDIR
ncbi:Copper-containing nitrite reductase precursor [compost metagenome]